MSGHRATDSLAFPSGFVWGCATAAYQVEGGASDDGRGPSIWDTFSRAPGKIWQNQNGDRAADSYHLYKEDVRLLKEVGVSAYRLSISWPRVIPDGDGPINSKGLDYYDRLIDLLGENGIAPYVTLFHWDLPDALVGGWMNRATAERFADYAALIARHFGDRVNHFITTNEFVCFTDYGYRTGLHSPGLKLDDAQVNQARHHGVLAHGLGVQAIRANVASDTLVGLAENAVVYVPVIETPEHIAAARKATRIGNAPFLTALMEGQYLPEYLEQEGANAPMTRNGDLNIVASPVDFVGLNIYTPQYVRADDSSLGYAVVTMPSSHPRMSSPWLAVGPECAYWGVRNVCDCWSPTRIYITENGAPSEDIPDANGCIEDVDRIMYLRNHLSHVHRAVSEGYPVRGYFLWSLIDNFEWSFGYSKRFGIHYVDFQTLKRTPKLSADWYRNVIAENCVR